jgi:chromosome partitioning protein
MKTIAFFNNKGGVGKTSLVYHVAWMMSELGQRVVAFDLDPQANLSAMFLDETALEKYWPEGKHPETIRGSIDGMMRGTSDITNPRVHPVHEGLGSGLGLVVGDLGLSGFEDQLSAAWPLCQNSEEAAFRKTTAFYRLAKLAADDFGAQWTLIDVGPNLGALNRAALIAADFVVTPLAPDLFSVQGLRNLGPTLSAWRKTWSQELIPKAPKDDPPFPVPSGDMKPVGYVVMQHAVREDRPVKAYARWINRMPLEYSRALFGTESPAKAPAEDSNCLATIKHYRSLMPMAMEARKPIFSLKAADGAIGAHSAAVRDCYGTFQDLTKQLFQRCK